MVFEKKKEVTVEVDKKPEERKHGQTREEASYPYSNGSRSGEEDGWAVEARYVYPVPIKLGDQIFDNRWRTVDFRRSPIGVPSSDIMHVHAASMGLLPYISAQALRWCFLAEINRDGFGGLCMETRLVKHRVKYSVSAEAVSAHDNLGGDLAQFSHTRPVDMQGNGRKQPMKEPEAV